MFRPQPPQQRTAASSIRSTDLFKDFDLDVLAEIGYSEEDKKMALLYLPQYLHYRSVYPLNRFSEYLFTMVYAVKEDFWTILDLIFCLTFSNGRHAAEGMDDPGVHGKEIYLSMVELMPGLVEFLVPEDEYDEGCKAELLAYCLPQYVKMIYAELACQSAYISELLKREPVPASHFVTKEMSMLFYMKLEKRFKERTV